MEIAKGIINELFYFFLASILLYFLEFPIIQMAIVRGSDSYGLHCDDVRVINKEDESAYLTSLQATKHLGQVIDEKS